MDDDTNCPKFWLLLRQAQESADAVDNFDLKSGTPSSVDTFNALYRQQFTDAEELIRHIQQNGSDILSTLEECLP
jgi:hypothetical protein